MTVTAKELSEFLNGTLEGDPDVQVSKPAKIEEGGIGAISFIAKPQYAHYAYTTDASVLLVSDDFELEKPIKPTLIRVKDVYTCVSKLLAHFSNQMGGANTGIDSKAFIDPSCSYDESVTVGAFCFISKKVKIGKNCIIHPQVFLGEGVEIGDDVVLFPGVKIYHGCVLGDRVKIHSNTIIGSDGFGFAPQKDGSYVKVPQVGIVQIGNDVEIGSNCVIDRATMGATVIHDGVKLDNLIQVAHNVEIGKNTVIAAQAGVAGSTKIGENCMIGGQAGFVGHITVADGSKVQAQSGVARSLKTPNKAWYGSPAFPYNSFLRSQVLFQKLPDLMDKIRELEKKLENLKNS